MLDETKSGSTGTAVDTSIDPLLASILTVGGAPLNAELRRVTALLDDVRLYNRALSEAEIQALFNGKGVLAGGPGPRPEVSIERSGDGRVSITWETGVLQSTSVLGGEWENVEGASSPHVVSPEGTAFFRVMVPAE